MHFLVKYLVAFFILFAVFCAISVKAQETLTISGIVKSKDGASLAGASVALLQTNQSAITDLNGHFQISNVPAGKHKIRIRFIGYIEITKDVTLPLKGNKDLSFTLYEDKEQLSEVSVVGRTAIQETNRQAFNVTAVDAKKLYNTTLDISGALDKVAGVRVRESGGVGSNFNLSLNGFSGNRVRYFIDGIPMDNFGSSFQINNIPINVAERLEVYKGVVPIWLGSDALGGAINIVTGDRYHNYIDASYSYGSFNTHRSVINTAVTSKSGFTFQLNAFQNYSDNDYRVTVEASDGYTGVYAPATRMRRFHDTYHNETLIANVGVVGRSYADKLLFGVTLGQNYKEIQTGARMDAVFGGWHRRGNILMPTLKYRKANLIKGLDITLNANYNLGNERNIDTLSQRFNWSGTSKPATSEGRGKANSKYRNNNGLITATANYKIAEQHTFALSNVFTTFYRKGSDPFNTNFTQGAVKPKLQKNVLGLGYTYDIKDRWSASLFGKYLHQKNSSMSSLDKMGFGVAASYFASPNLQFKVSYERANRLPESNELFGDVELLEGNMSLKPEASENINAGLSYSFSVNNNHRFLVNANAIYRYSSNYIYSRYNLNQSALVLDNLDGVFTIGGEGEVRYSYKKWLSAGTSLTYQYLENRQDSVFNSYGTKVASPVYMDQMPNIPYFFSNSDVSLSLRNIGQKGNNLSVGYNLLYVHSFWLYWPSRGGRSSDGEKKEVPQQLSHDVNMVYSMKNGRYNIGLEARNITDALLYDNFSLQKPGRGFYINLRYFLNKINN